MDVMCLTPGLTRTNLIKGFSDKFFLGNSPYSVANAALRDLGREETTSGILFHEI
jgi:hypothetical protein